MGWIKKVPPEHTCDIPEVDTTQIGVGSKWRCDSCGLAWTLRANVFPFSGSYWSGDSRS